jgi:hypothetical protein
VLEGVAVAPTVETLKAPLSLLVEVTSDISLSLVILVGAPVGALVSVTLVGFVFTPLLLIGEALGVKLKEPGV